MRVEVANLTRRNTGLSDRDLHRASRTVAVLGTGCNVMSVRRHAVADEFGERFRAAGKRVAQSLDDQDAGAFAHDEAVPRPVEGARSLLGCLIEAGRKSACGSKAPETDHVHACFCPTAHRDIGFIAADKTSRIANSLDACRTRGHRGAEWTFKAVTDRDVARREVHQK